MPLYEYKCSHCGSSFERLVQQTSDHKEAKCEICGKKAQKILSPIGILFKGSGFYSTDSRRGSAGVPAKNKDKGKESQPKENAESSKKENKTD